ncbi:TPA: hypothetical protein N0F65_002073 [Lagenidium giganteum]|uniref:Uncharacterized protein n=1 Tax=Lagenidium giganteum TaxID=4803 RepID=A0AAV2ZDG0_9STRA|nr:TPA: hypothetical protein N0F65_002073 [Lagenidium giganteum]
MSQDGVEVFSKDTFLTSLRNGGGSGSNDGGLGTHGMRFMVEEPAAMVLVREKHAQLHEVVASLSEKITAVLGRQEKDFLAAYRAHMYNVQKELHDMREKMHRNETVENKTEKIKKIEEERDWYRKEALRLDAFTTSMTKDLKYMKEKLQSIEEDRNWLEKQLKACKKQNKLLRAELDVRLSASENANDTRQASVLPAFDSAKSNGNAVKRYSRKSTEGESNLPYLANDTAAPMLLEEREQKYKRQIRTLKRDLQQKTNELLHVKQQCQFIKGGNEPTHLERFFLQCVDSVKEEVGRRRSSMMERKDWMRQSYEKSRNQRYDVGPEFEDFTSAERVRVIERLLAHDEVLTFLYEHLFPSPGQETMETARRLDSAGASVIGPSESTKSLPESNAPGGLQGLRQLSVDSPGRTQVGQPAGSGAAAAAAASRGGGLPIDDFTKDYLRSM